MGFTLDEAFKKIDMEPYPAAMLRQSYEQEHRKYHNLNHLEQMLSHVPNDLMGVEVVLEAILFHDLVYLPHPVPQGYNEALSIAEYTLYEIHVLCSHPNPFAHADADFTHERQVIEAINATSRHTEDQSNLSAYSKLVLDLDLSGFKDKDEFDKNSELIREEFSAVDEKVFNENRLAFLKAVLSRKQIYYVMLEWEAAARQNLQDEVLRLTKLQE